MKILIWKVELYSNPWTAVTCWSYKNSSGYHIWNAHIAQLINTCVKCIIVNKKLGNPEGFLNCIEKGVSHFIWHINVKGLQIHIYKRRLIFQIHMAFHH